MTTKTVEMSLSEMIGALLGPVIVSRPRYRCDKGVSPRSSFSTDLRSHEAHSHPICSAQSLHMLRNLQSEARHSSHHSDELSASGTKQSCVVTALFHSVFPSSQLVLSVLADIQTCCPRFGARRQRSSRSRRATRSRLTVTNCPRT